MKLIFLALAGLLFFSGCIDESGIISNRIDCLNLSSQASGILPNCENEYSCFAEINKYFNFSSEYFSANTKMLLYEYKNNLARSWLYYNRTIKNLEAIHEICYTKTRTEELSKNINELANNIDESFKRANTANEVSFKIIAAEKTYLESLGINLIKEENLANDYIKLTDNLNQFQEKVPHKSDSYYYFYYQTIKEFEELGTKYNIKTIFVKENDLVDFLYAATIKAMGAEVKGTTFFPFVVNFAGFLLEKIKSGKDIKETGNFLKNLPAFEFLNVYAKIASERDSVNEHFIKMLKSLSAHHKEAYERIDSLSVEITGKNNNIKQELNSNLMEYEKIFLLKAINEEIRILPEGSYLTSQNNSFEEIRNSSIAINIRLNALNLDYYSGRLILGIYLSELKRINAELAKIEYNLNLIKKSYLMEVDNLCSSKIKGIIKQLKNQKNGISEKILLRESWFYAAKSFYEKATHCEEILQGYSKLTKGQENQEKIELNAAKEKLAEKIGKEIDSLGIESLFEKVRKKFSFIKTLAKYSKNEKVGQLDKEFEKIDGHFKEGSFIITEENYKNLLVIQLKIKEFYQKLKIEEISQISLFLEKNAELSIMLSEQKYASAVYLNRMRFSVPFSYLGEEIPVNFKILPKFLEIKEKTNNLTAFYSDNSLNIIFQEIPAGQSYIEWLSEEDTEVKRKLEFAGLNGVDAIFSEKISLDSERIIQNFNFSEELETYGLNISQIYILSNNKEIKFFKNQNSLQFVADLSKSAININYVLRNGLLFEKKLISREKISEDEYLDSYQIKLTNQLPFKIEKTNQVLLEYIPEGTITKKNICCNKGLLKISGSSVIIESNGINPHEMLELKAEIQIKDYSEITKALTEKYRLELLEFSKSDFSEVNKKAKEGLNKLEEIINTTAGESQIDIINQAGDKIREIELLNNSLTKQKNAVEEDLGRIGKKIEETEDFQAFLDTEENEKIEKISELFSYANTSSENQRYADAEKSLSEAEKIITSIRIANQFSEKEIGKKITEIVDAFNELSLFGICCYDNNIDSLLKDKEIFLTHIQKKEFSKAFGKKMEILQQMDELGETEKKEFDKLILSTKDYLSGMKKISALNSLSEYTLLKKELSAFEKTKKVVINYIPPITISELENLEKNAKGIKKEIDEKINPILQGLYSTNKEETKKALRSYLKAKEDLQELKTNVDSIKDFIKKAYFQLKEDAFQLVNDLKYDTTTAELKDKASNEFVKGNLIKAIALTGMASAPTEDKEQNSLILGFLIIIVIIGIYAGYSFFKKDGGKEPRTMKVFGQHSYV